VKGVNEQQQLNNNDRETASEEEFDPEENEDMVDDMHTDIEAQE
jgi:hypothetical protein